MDDKQVQFIPFNAINEFMLNDYRLHVIQDVLAGTNRLPGDRRSAINGLIKRHVQVPGFRNSSQAPTGVKARASVSVFERRPEMTAQILQGWSELYPELRQKVFDFLKAREWETLPPEADRSKLPGFLVEWPEGQTYDVLDAAFAELYPDEKVEANDLRLMIVWVANRLPYDMYNDDDEVDEVEEYNIRGWSYGFFDQPFLFSFCLRLAYSINSSCVSSFSSHSPVD
jgi:hypothetical protein